MALVVAALMLQAGSQAYAFDLGGYLGKLLFKFTGRTSSNLYDGNWNDQTEDSWGVGKVSSILSDDGSNETLWVDKFNAEGQELVYYMRGIKDMYADLNSNGAGLVLSKGGEFSLWLQPAGTMKYDVLNRSLDKLNYSTITDTPGKIAFARFTLTPGIIPVASGVPVDPTQVSLSENFYAPGADGLIHGDGFAYGTIDPTWGIYGSLLNTNSQLGGSDVSLQFDFIQSAYKGFNTQVNDPVRAVTPEPVSSVLFLLGAGAIGADYIRKKKKA